MTYDYASQPLNLHQERWDLVNDHNPYTDSLDVDLSLLLQRISTHGTSSLDTIDAAEEAAL